MDRRDDDEERFSEVLHLVATLRTMMPKAADVVFVLNELEKADAFGVFTDPTAWKKSAADRIAMRGLMRGAQKFAEASEAFGMECDRILAARVAAATR